MNDHKKNTHHQNVPMAAFSLPPFLCSSMTAFHSSGDGNLLVSMDGAGGRRAKIKKNKTMWMATLLLASSSNFLCKIENVRGQKNEQLAQNEWK
jgi:hypothetical protein